MPSRKDFSQVAFDVMRQATGQVPKETTPAPKPQKEVASEPPKAKKQVHKKTGH